MSIMYILYNVVYACSMIKKHSLVSLFVSTNDLKNVYLSLPSQAFSIIRIGQELVG